MRLFFCLFLIAIQSYWLSCQGANLEITPNQIDLDQSSRKNIASIEFKYFAHSFDKERDEERLARLEKLIFGEALSGNIKERAQKLIAVSPVMEAEKTERANEKPIAKSAAKPLRKQLQQSAPVLQVENKKLNQPPSLLNEEEKLEGVGDYPQISALERVILQESFEGQALSARLARLETKAFGSPSDLPDFSQRTDELEAYVEFKLKRKLQDTGETGSEPSFRLAPAASSNTVAKTQGVSGIPASAQSNASTYDQSLAEFESDSPDKKQTIAPRSRNQEPKSGQANMSKQVIATVANTVLGVSGFGGLLAPVNAARAIAASKSKQNQAESSGAFDSEYVQNPLLASPAPPPQEAKLLTKVSWCEIQIFGQSYPSMHLTDRLRQLSKELQWATGKSDFDLMDNIQGLIAKVQTVKKNRPIGSNPDSASTQY